MAASIEIASLNKRFRRESGEVLQALNDVTLDVDPGQFLVLLGPSGCGKTTLLRSLAGLESPDSGRIVIGERVVFSSQDGVAVPTERRDLSMVFQSYALWPHMTVQANVAYPLRYGRKDRTESSSRLRERVAEALELVGIPELGSQYPGQISGGQQQRVALARAIVRRDSVILFDEPLSNVDARVRERLRIEIRAMHKQLGFTAVYVTHDQEEAMELADVIAVMKAGRIVQSGAPRAIYEYPASRYVAGFLGTINEFEGKVSRTSGDSIEIETSHGRFVVARPPAESGGVHVDGDDRVVVIARPEHMALSATQPDGPNVLPGTVANVAFVGPFSEYTVIADGKTLVTRASQPGLARAGEDVWLSLRPTDLRVLPYDDN